MNKLFTKIVGAALGLTMAIGVGVAVGSNVKEASPVQAAAGDVLKKYDTNSSTFKTGYARQSGDNFVWWGQKGFYGANSDTNHGKLKPTAADLPVVKAQNASATTSTTGLYYLYTSEAVANVGKVEVYLSAKSGSSTVNAYVVSSSTAASSGSATWSKVTLASTSTSAQGANVASANTYTFTFDATETGAKYYGVVFSTSSYWRATGLTFKLIEGDVKYTVTYNSNGGTVSPTSEQVSKNGHPTFPTPSYTGYTFDGWQVNGAGTYYTSANASSYTVTAAVIFVAHWTSASAESITVTGSSSLYVGDSDITLTATPENFSPATYTWNSSNTGVATISGSGATATLHAVSKGTTVITASASGTGGTVTSNEFTVTIKKFSIALSSSEVSMKASKSTTVTVTPTDANGTVVVTAESNNTSVATTSVNGTTITITSGSDGGASTTITVSAKDNNGASGYHTAANKTISVEVTAGYVVGNKITALPSSDKFVFLGNEAKTSWVGGTGTSAPETTNDEAAALFVYSTTGTLRYYNQETEQSGNYIYNGGGNTTVSLSSSSVEWASGLGDTDYPGLLQLTGGRFLIFNGGVAKAYAISNKTIANAPYFIYAYEATASTPTVALSGDSVTGLKDDPADTSLTLTISNFTATGLNVSYKDNGESSFSGSSSVASVSCGYNTGANTVSVSFNGIGSTTVKLSVTRGSGDPIEKIFTVSVSPKPASITINNTLKSGYLEVRNSNSASTYGYQQLDITALDTEGNPYEGQLDYTVESGSSYIGLSDSHRVYGKAVGTGVVKVSAHALSSVYAEVNVKSMDDTKTGVKSVTFNPSLTANAGDVLSISDVIATKKAKSYFGYSEGLDIDDSELLFSYSEHDYENAVPAASFIYACDEETAVGDPENQTVYVYCTLDSSWSSSFPITVTQTSNAVTGVSISNVSDHAKTITRTDSFQLALAFTPSNATNKNVTYSLSNQSTGSTITVSQTGLVSAGTRAGSTARVTVTTEDGGFTDYVNITVGIEEMSYDIVEPSTVSVASSISVGDRIFLAAEGTRNSSTVKKYMTGYTASYGQVSDYTDSPDASEAYVLDVVAGASNGQFAFKYGNKYLSYSGSSNTLNTTTEISAESSWTVSISNGKATITNANSTTRVIWYNASSPRFACYTNKTDGNDYFTPIIYKESGGNSSHDVDAVLLNAVLDNFGSGKTYEWSDSCTAFDEDAWLDACIALTEITNYSSYKLNRAVGNIAGNEVEQFIAKYDIIIGKFGETHDHLDRYAQGGINYGVRSGVSPSVNIIGENTNTVAIIVIISMVSVTAIGGYFFLCKRKEI